MGEQENKTKTWPRVVAKILSVILVIALMLVPVLLSALSLLTADNITRVVTETVNEGLRDAQKRTDPVEYVKQNLPEDIADTDEVNIILENVLENDPDGQTMDKVMESDAVKEFVNLYTEDLTNSLAGNKQTSQLDAEKLKELTADGMDDIVAAVKEVNPEVTTEELDELRTSITKVVDEQAEDIIASFPDPGEVTKELKQSVPGMDLAMKIMAGKKMITIVSISLLVLLSAGVFLCLLQEFRGFRSLSVSLLIGGGFNAVLYAILAFGASLVIKAIPLAIVKTVLRSVLGTVTRSMLVWTIVLLLVGGALLGTYFVLKKLRAKKVPVQMEEA